jgi:hypothetical protein
MENNPAIAVPVARPSSILQGGKEIVQEANTNLNYVDIVART